MNQSKKWNIESRYLAFGGLIVIFVGLVWYFRAVINSVAIAALFAYVLYPVVKFLSSRTRLSHRAAVVIVYIIAIVLLVSAPAIIVPTAVSQIRLLSQNIESLTTHYSELLETSATFMNWTFSWGQFLPDLPGVSTDMFTPLAESAFAIVSFVTKNFMWVLVILVSFYYFLLDGHRMGEIVVMIAPESHQNDVRQIMDRLRYVWSDYMRSQLAFMLAVGVMDAVAWLAIGLPGAIFLGLFTGLTSFVHEIGAIVSGVLSVLVALLEGSNFLAMSNFWFAVVVFIVYMVLTGIKNIWLRPIIVGRTVHVHPGIVFVVVIGALVFHGALAAFLAVPVLLSLWEIGKYLRCRALGLPPFPDELETKPLESS
ncbi:MAG: AI-2E family transporter [Anaerolineales bacterium]|nr:AI-2E family transporter [Chloroflexota bacterium]MBL6981860.1 AI-2E family transporter [Anaerolineales bacterium]